MNASRQYSLGLLAVSLLTTVAAGQQPDDRRSLMTPPAAATPGTTAPVFALPDVNTPNGGTAPSDHGGVIGGVGIYVIQPYFQNNPAYTVFSQEQVTPLPFKPNVPNTQTLSEIADRVSVRSNMAVAPLVWLGYVSDDGFGGRVRWWSFREGTDQTIDLPPFNGEFFIANTTKAPIHPVIAVTGNQITVASAAPLGLQAFGDTVGIQHGAEAVSFAVTTELSLQVGDIEATQSFQAGVCNFLVAGGIRVASIDQTYNAYDGQSGTPGAPRSLLSTYDFVGAGPTLALEVRRPLGSCGLTPYGIARGSIVFGSAQQNAVFFGQELRNDDPNPQFASQHRTRGLPVADLEAGLEYGRALGSSWLFGQVGLVGQEWFEAGSASRATNATVLTTLRPALGGAAIDSNLSFFGLAVRIGLQF
jgi:hypothetical protein